MIKCIFNHVVGLLVMGVLGVYLTLALIIILCVWLCGLLTNLGRKS